ncbi:MAG: stage II sporulation protein D [Syntrophomonadaceae bacterium]
MYLHQEDKVIDLELEEYIKGTVAAEMPASFHIEALKAQAVCARTYAVKKIISHTTYPGGADLSDEISTCQAFVGSSDFAPANPDRAKLLEKIEKAVNETRGEILLFDSQPIDALYCSTCGGRTESANAVWGGQIGYLQPVKCSDCDKSPHYQEKIEVPNEAILGLVGDGGSPLKIKVISHTPGGRAQKISINGKSVDATTLRQKLGLPSTWIEFHTSARTTIVTSRGYGHGVGLCQFGANGMAERGKNYRQILQKYYQGVTFYNLGY